MNLLFMWLEVPWKEMGDILVKSIYAKKSGGFGGGMHTIYRFGLSLFQSKLSFQSSIFHRKL